MQIIKTVHIKQVVTDSSKSVLKTKFMQERQQLEVECQQLLFEQRKLKHKYSQSKQEVRHHFQREIARREEEIDLIDFKLEQLDLLEVGSELVEREVHALVDVNIGDHWDKVMKKQSIVIEDNVVIRIDEE